MLSKQTKTLIGLISGDTSAYRTQLQFSQIIDITKRMCSMHRLEACSYNFDKQHTLQLSATSQFYRWYFFPAGFIDACTVRMEWRYGRRREAGVVEQGRLGLRASFVDMDHNHKTQKLPTFRSCFSYSFWMRIDFLVYLFTCHPFNMTQSRLLCMLYNPLSKTITQMHFDYIEFICSHTLPLQSKSHCFAFD